MNFWQWLTLSLCLTASVALAGFNDFCLNGFSLTGGGQCREQIPTLSLSPITVAFGEISTGSTRYARFTVTNSGKGVLTNISTSKPAAPYRIYSSAICKAATLTGGQSCNFGIEYKPTAAVLSRYSTLVTSNQFASPTVALVSGTGKVSVSEDHSDDFTAADGTLLATYNSAWATTGYGSMANLKIYSNALRAEAYGSGAARYTTSSKDISQATLGAMSGSTNLERKGVTVRSSATDLGYACYLYTSDGTNWTRMAIFKSNSLTMLGTNVTISKAINTTHDIRLTASGTSTVTLECSVDGEAPMSRSDSSSPVTSGSPGVFLYEANGIAGNGMLDSWRDY